LFDDDDAGHHAVYDGYARSTSLNKNMLDSPNRYSSSFGKSTNRLDVTIWDKNEFATRDNNLAPKQQKYFAETQCTANGPDSYNMTTRVARTPGRLGRSGGGAMALHWVSQ
jgi:hypothetical protein